MTQMSGHTSDHHSLMLQLLLCGCCIHLRIQVMYHLLQSVCRACLTIKYVLGRVTVDQDCVRYWAS